MIPHLQSRPAGSSRAAGRAGCAGRAGRADARVGSGAAPPTIGGVLEALLGTSLPLRVTAFDGSAAGRPDADVRLHIASELGVRYLVWAPGDLGLARGYLAGEIELHGVHPGNPYELFRALKLGTPVARPTPRELLDVLGSLAALRGARGRASRRGAFGSLLPPPPPQIELLPRWRRALESLREPAGRRAAAVAAHYDVSNEFFELLLGPSMAYTCGVYTDAGDTLEEAQERKFELVARKLGLRPGMRLLDVGCGWGGMLRQAATHGVDVVGVTLSGHQSEWLARMVEREGLGDRVTIWTGDYRRMPRGPFDAVSSIGMLEHMGVRNYPTYFAELASRVRPGGRVLVHSITRADTTATTKPEPFTDRYVFPDGELAAPSVAIGHGHDAGLELHHEENLRRSYPLTLRAWSENLERHWDACVAQVGEPTAKVYGLYLAGSRLAFELNWLQVHQFLFSRPGPAGESDYPFRPDWVEP